VRRFDYPAKMAQQDVADLTQLPLQIVSTAALAEKALGLAVEYSSTAYDSAYIALARHLSLPLVTADEKLVRRFQKSGLDVRFLGDWPSGI
jgi:predicted nucleic acid-binding protein